MTKGRHFVLGATALLISTIVALMALEYAIRWTMPVLDPSGHISFQGEGSKRPYLGVPGSVQRQIKNTGDFDVSIRFNKWGFRDDRDVSTATEADWITVGDSLSFGWGVEEKDRVTEQLEGLLGKKIFNLSVPGDLNTTNEIIHYAKTQGAEIGRLILFFSMEARLLNYDAVAKVQERSTFDGWGLSTLKHYLMANSALYFLITSIVHRSPQLKKIFIDLGLINPNMMGFPRRKFDQTVIEASARKLAEVTNGYQSVVIVCPSRGLWVDETAAEERKIHAALLSQLSKLGVEFIDTVPAFEESGRPLDSFFKNDGHWRPEGHKMLARFLAARLPK